MPELTVRKNEEAHRHELLADGVLAGFAEYSLLARGILFSHTEVLPAFEGQGYSKVLIRHALDDARALGREVVPACPAVAAFLRKNPEYIDLVTPVTRRAFHI